MNDFKPFWRQLFIVCAPFFGVIGNACANSFTATLLPLLLDPDSDIKVTNNMASWIASIIVIGCVVGSSIGPLLMDKFGRKKILFRSTIPPLIGWYSISFANSATIILLAKLLQGIGFGLSISISFHFVAEITTPKYRGSFISLVAFGMTLGIFVGHFIGSLFPWRMAAIVCSSFHILTFFLYIFSAESPIWLASRNKFDESEKAFFWLRGKGEAASKEFNAMVSVQKMQSAIENSSLNAVRSKHFLSRLTHPALYKPLAITIILFLVFHGTGVNVILDAYCIVVLKQLIDDSDGAIDHHKVMLSFDIIRLFTSILAIYLIRVMKRKSVLITNLLVIKVLVLLSIFSYLKAIHIEMLFSNWIIIGLLWAYTFFMYVGILSFTFPIAGEIMPMASKSIGSLLASLVSACILFATLKFASVMFTSLGLHGTFIVYALITLFGTIYLYFYLPETKGKTLQEIETHFTGEIISDQALTSEMHLMMRQGNDECNK